MFFVLKKKFAVMFLLMVIVICGTCFSGALGVFKSGTRNLPVYSVDRSDNKISITFNCAWEDKDIDSILKTLDKYNAKASFFIVGEWAEKYPDKVKKIAESGHELGGHSYNHTDYTTLSDSGIKEDISKTSDAIEKACGVKIKLIRVPSGSYDSSVITSIEDAGYTPVQWSVDTIDYGDADCESIFGRATVKTQSGDIILMHTGTPNTASALPRILDSLGGKFQFSMVSDLLFQDNFYVGNDGKMRKNS